MATIKTDKIEVTSVDIDGSLAIGGTLATSLTIGRNAVTTTFVSGSIVDFTGVIVTGLVISTARQEEIAAEEAINTDITLTQVLSFTPLNVNPTSGLNESILLFLNGVLKRQGVGLDYIVSEGTSGTEITWLANSGTAVDLDTSDILTVVYSSSD